MTTKKIGWVMLFVFLMATLLQAQLTLLHPFAGAVSDGSVPMGSLILSGSTLYGMTPGGGANDSGTIFKININGTGYTLLHSFERFAPGDGAGPWGDLVLSGSTLYGMTLYGGASDRGAIFKINTSGTGFALLHSFAGGESDGQYPKGSLVLSGSVLYGMTYQGGTGNFGTIFKINTDGAGFALFHSFAGNLSDGGYPHGDLMLSGSVLFGMTFLGGANGYGTIFKINTDGTGYALLHSFDLEDLDGIYPYHGSLKSSGSTLYGVTSTAGAGQNGTIFKINMDGTGFEVLHSFAFDSSEGTNPYGSLYLSGTTLYGMTYGGGAGAGYGTIFKINTDGTGFELAHLFAGGASDGANPRGSLILSGISLYGMTQYGGASDLGIVFSYHAPTADIAIAKSVDNLTPAQGSEINFTVSATNNGPDSASGLQVTDQLPTGLGYVSSTPSQGTYDYGTGVWEIGTLADDATATLTIIASADDLGDITNTAAVSALNESDPDNSNDSASATVTISNQYSLTTAANPAIGGTVTPAGTNWYNSGASVQVQATSKPGYIFTGWSGSLTGFTNPATITMNGTKSVVANFTAGKILLVPVLVAPSNGATGQPVSVTLKWQDRNSSPQELKYRVRIKKAGGAYSNITLAANTIQYIKSGLTPSKTYYWNVQALGNGTSIKTSAWANGGVDFKFTTAPPVTLKVPTLVAPANGATNQPTTMTFEWLDTNSSPQELFYKVRIKPAGGTYAGFKVAANSVSFLRSGLAKNKAYFWSVQALGNGTSIKNSAFPADWKFTTIK